MKYVKGVYKGIATVGAVTAISLGIIITIGILISGDNPMWLRILLGATDAAFIGACVYREVAEPGEE